jgi:hypothetical protein
MTEGRGGRKVGKSGSPKVVRKPEVGSPKSEVKKKSEVGMPNAELENTSAIDIPQSELNKSEIVNRKSEMEVHHHPQLEHKSKPWKEYLLEGFMIFIAVTMGFFAESLREHIGDNTREKEFAKALYTELKVDSATAATKMQLRIEREKTLDYLYTYFKDSSLTTLPRTFYPAFTNLYIVNIYTFEPKDGILSQLKNSGSLRYFKSLALQKLLGDLNVSINNIRNRNDQEYQFFASPLKLFLLQHYDFNWLDRLRGSYPVTRSILNLIEPYLQSKRTIKGEVLNAATFNRTEAANMVSCYKQMLVSSRSLQLTDYIAINHQILQELRKTYDLENE